MVSSGLVMFLTHYHLPEVEVGEPDCCTATAMARRAYSTMSIFRLRFFDNVRGESKAIKIHIFFKLCIYMSCTMIWPIKRQSPPHALIEYGGWINWQKGRRHEGFNLTWRKTSKSEKSKYLFRWKAIQIFIGNNW